MRLICVGCGETPWWSLPREGDKCWCGRGELVWVKEKAAFAASPGSRHPLGVLPLSDKNDSTDTGRPRRHGETYEEWLANRFDHRGAS